MLLNLVSYVFKRRWTSNCVSSCWSLWTNVHGLHNASLISSSLIYYIVACSLCKLLQAIATPRELLLKKVPFPLPNPDIFNLDQINSFTVDTIVSDNGSLLKLLRKSCSMKIVISLLSSDTLLFLFPFQLSLSVTLESSHINWRATLLNFSSLTGRVGQILVPLSVRGLILMRTLELFLIALLNSFGRKC